MSKTNLLFMAALLLALFLIMPATQLWDWDEALYARTGVEMFETGNLLLPRFNGEVFAHKPPLGYWMMGLGAELFGGNEAAPRFFSASALLISVWFVSRSAAIIFDARVGDLSLYVFGSSLMSVYLGAAAMLDAYLLAGCSVSIWAFLHLFTSKERFIYYLSFALGGFVTLMVKGPVGPALIGGMVIISFAFSQKDQRPGWRVFWRLVLAGAFAFGAFLLWFIPANQASNGVLAGEGIGVHIIGRALSPMEGHGGRGILGFLVFLPFYLPVLFVGIAPWSAYLPVAFKHMSKAILHRQRVLLLAWFLPCFVLFSLVATKLPHYIFPAIAPLSVLIAATLAAKKQADWFGKFLTTVLYIGLGMLLIWIGLMAGDVISGPIVLFGLLSLTVLGALIWFAPKDWSQGPKLALLVLIAMAAFYWSGLREAEKFFKLSEPIASALKENATSDDLVLTSSYNEPSLVFYAERPADNPIVNLALSEMIETIIKTAKGFAIVTEDEKQAILEMETRISFDVYQTSSAVNFNSNNQAQTVHLLGWRH